jgi:polysaccharide export outer membrane protein
MGMLIMSLLKVRFLSCLLPIMLIGAMVPRAFAAADSHDTPVAAASKSAAPMLRIAAGDLLELTVFDTPELSGKLRVDSDGNVTMPIGGVLHVDGLTAEQAAAAAQARLRERDILNDPHVSVFVTEYATQGVSVLGEVKNPGVYPVLGSHGLLDFVSVAGGVTPNAGKAVTVTHKSDPAHPIVVRLDNAPDVSTRANIEILPGDSVIVARSGIVYVVGDLQKPGGFLIENNDRLTVLQAVALAQGTNRTAALNHSKLIRQTSQGRSETDVQLKPILDGKKPDIRLEDGDILFVPSSGTKNWAYRGVEAAIQMSVGMATYGRF